jgi:nucleotide-binding universal stress UspA family protein
LGEGNVAEVIEEFVKEHTADLLVLGTSSRMGLGKAFLGSIAEELIRESPCPVLAVGPHVTTLASDGVRSIVCATDFSDASARATQFAISLADEYQAHLTLVHVLQDRPKDSLHLTAQVIEKRMLDTIPAEPELPYRPEIVVETGSVADRILNLAADLSADVIVMGVRGVGSFAEMASHFGSIAHKVVSFALCPVLTVNDVPKLARQ